MSLQLINLSPDLNQLREDGYFIQVKNGHLLVRDVPYVDARKRVRIGTLVSTLTLAGDKTQKPDTHVVYFDGDMPCDSNGSPLSGIVNQSKNEVHGISIKHMFSSKPAGGYKDYYEKMSTYAAMLAGHAEVIKPGISPKVFRLPEEEEDSVFTYAETASARAGIGVLTDRLTSEHIAIIGLGGTGSYVLDFVAKTPVREIRLFDNDEFLQHNAFRAPGAPSIEELRLAPKKVEYLKSIYSRMHRNISAHDTKLDGSTLHLLDGVTFAFICIDSGEAKRQIIQKLEALDIPFIDVGMGLELINNSLGGILRVTTSTPGKRDHFHDGRVSYGDSKNDDLYSSNIQVADLNALNAVLAVIKWKKIRGFYRDIDQELHSTYTTDGNMLLNEIAA